MLEVKEDTLESLLRKAIQGLQSSESRIVSYTKKIKNINPLEFFDAGSEFHMERSFWKSTIDEFTLVGIGNAYTVGVGHLPINELEEAWQSIIHNAVIYNPYEEPGIGLAAIGGMDFDPLKQKTSLWNKFKQNALRIPRFMLANKGKNFYLTITIMVKTDDDPKEITEHLLKQETFLLAKRNIPSENITILHQKEVEPNKWKDTVKKTTEYITAGHVEKVVLARELQLEFQEDVQLTKVLQQLMDKQPTSYIFAYEVKDNCFIGATPERLVKVEHNELLSTCLAGTAPRGQNEEDDEKLGYELLHDDKNLQEHDFVVQMIKDSVEEYCEDLQIPEHPVLYKLRNLQHLYTPVKGKFKDGYSIFHVIEKLHPTPALGGEPRPEALTYIREHEQLDRGWYGAPFGWIDNNQNGEFAVAIRSGLIKNNKASLFAGCGVVKDSDPEAEYEETRIKFMPMLTVLGG
ncbi:isochorismate synthase [Ornithinibacillus halotolerans]|uniref:Isochorismate synthase MenF n=1 Tax=Ornithinibacillus halotolerans TaxID=1274357 RepID=A0A916W8A6_9BACI|nr:isochorismate synthase [Ornithinibacillus halotolerans]GGA76474.1 menaquinone-specific isochorismate synthase [Ornithinibacillus halotolerans]